MVLTLFKDKALFTIKPTNLNTILLLGTKTESERNKVCRAMSEIPIYVDKFHFYNHIDTWCILF